MFAVQFDRFGPPGVLFLGACAEPHAGPGTVRVRVRAAGVSPVDVMLRAGLSPSAATMPLPHIPGVDAAGVVDELGDGVTGVAVGDEVFGTVDIASLGGASAEFAVLAFWQARPAAMTWAEAGAASSSIETATRALDALGDMAGRTLLVDGAAGGVGSIAVQLAVARGARVIGAAHPENHTFVAALGAIPVAYGAGLAERVSVVGTDSSPVTVDLALDAAGAGSLPELVALTGDASRVITLADFGGPALGVRLSRGRFAGEPDGRHGLRAAADLAQRGLFRVPVQEVFAPERAADAHTAMAGRHREGRIVLGMPPAR